MASSSSQALSLDFLVSDSIYEREVLRLPDGESEEDLNRRVVQTAEDVGMSDHEIALCLGPYLIPATVHVAPSIISTAVYSPHSRGSLNTSSTAPTSNYSADTDEPRASMQTSTHKRNISIGALFSPARNQATSIGHTLTQLPDTQSPQKSKQHFTLRDVEINILNGKGFGKISRKLKMRRASHAEAELVPWQAEPSPMEPATYSTGGIHASLTGRIDLKQDPSRLGVEQSNRSSRAASIHSNAHEQQRYRSRSGAFMKLGNKSRRSSGDPSDARGRAAWSQPGSSTNLHAADLDRPLPPLPTMVDELHAENHSVSASAMLASASPPYTELDLVEGEMKDALGGRAGLQVQSQNRTELRKLNAFRKKQLRGLDMMHEIERNKMLSVFGQQKELIDAKYRQALMHLIDDRQVVAELDLLEQLEERLKREQGKLRHMEAYCSPTSGRIVTSQNLSLLDAQRSLVDQLQSEQYSTASLNHLRERQDNDAARLPKQQEMELQELEDKRRKAIQAREEVEHSERTTLNSLIRRRRDASVARCNLRLEIWRRRYEGEASRPLPGPLPYFRSDFVFEARWMVDIPVRSVLDDVIPKQVSSTATA